MDQKEIVHALKDERERLIDYLAALPEGSWEHATLCEGWRVRDIVSHLVGNCADVLDQNLDDVGSPAHNQRQIDDRSTKTPNELLSEWREKGPSVEAIYEAFPPEIWEYDMGGVIGTVGRGVLRTLEDLWIHAQDIRIGLGHDASAGPGLDATLELVAIDLPGSFAHHRSTVGVLQLSLGNVDMSIPVGGSSRTVRISGDPVAFALAATGRTSLDAAEADGRLTVSPPLGEDAAALNIYGPAFDARL
jgi:uncharacterized protein (TIGR03083 family)